MYITGRANVTLAESWSGRLEQSCSVATILLKMGLRRTEAPSAVTPAVVGIYVVEGYMVR